VAQNLANDFANLVKGAFDAKSPFIARGELPLRVKSDDLDRKAMGEPPRQPADRPLPAVQIEQRYVAFGCAIELDDLRDAKSLRKLLPHVETQAIAAGKAQAMGALVGLRWRVEQIAAQLADILKARAVPARDVAPKFVHRKPVPDHHRAAAQK